jgi:TolB-like protein/Tfp pilus assembly protein PilF
MLAGKRAFPGESVASTLGAVMHRDPDPLNAPPALASIVAKCLAKSPAERFQSAAELRVALDQAATHSERKFPQRLMLAVGGALILVAALLGAQRLAGMAGSSSINAIAVLPLAIQSNEPEADYISDGIADSISNRLTRISGLKVIPNTIAQEYRKDAANFPKLVQELGVDAVLSGRIVQRGDDLTINIELNDTRRGRRLWGQQYTRKLAELLMVQNDISKEVSQRLRSHLSAHDQQRIESGSTSNPEAYQLYLKGAYYTAKFTQDGFRKGIDFLNLAIALDPGYADAYSALAYNYINQDDWFLPPADSAPQARAAALKALSLEETDVGAHVALAIETDWYEWDWVGADREFRRALEIDPVDGDALGYYSWFLPSMGRQEEAIVQARLQTKTYPLSFGANGNLGSVFVFTQRWDEAITQLRYAIDLNPNYWFDYYFLGRAYEQKGQWDLAIQSFQKGLELEGNTELWAGLGHAFAVSGNSPAAHRVLDHLNELSKQRYVAPYDFALVYLGLGEIDAAFTWLERAYQARSYLLAVYLNTDSRLKSLYGDPRYASLRRRMKLPPPS